PCPRHGRGQAGRAAIPRRDHGDRGEISRAPEKRAAAIWRPSLFLSAKLSRSGGASRALFGLELSREQPAEIGQRRIGADRKQLIARVGIENLLLRLDDILVLVETL